MNARVHKIPNPRNMRVVGMTGMNAKLRVRVGVEYGRMPALKSIVKSLRPTETLAGIAIRSITPLPVGIATENNRARVVAAPDTSLGHSLRVQPIAGKVKTLDPKWGMMLSHS